MGKRYGWHATRGSAPKRISLGVGLVIFLSIVAPGIAFAGVSGTYVGASPGEVNMIQIVETAGNHLIGHMEEDHLAGGAVQATNFTITGAVSGETVIMNIGSSILGTISASGTISDGTLHLVGGSGGSSFEMTLTRASLAEYQQAVGLLRQAAAANAADIAAAKQRSDARKAYFSKLSIAESRMKSDLAKTERMNEGMAEYPKVLAVRTKQLHAIDDRYRVTTRQMSEELERERGFIGAGQASVARAQIANGEVQANLSDSNLHMSVADHIIELKNSNRTMFRQVRQSELACRSATAAQLTPAITNLSEQSKKLQDGLNGHQITGTRAVEAQKAIILSRNMITKSSSLLSACDQFKRILPAFETQVKSDAGLYATEEKDWHTELAKQKQIIAAAEAAIE